MTVNRKKIKIFLRELVIDFRWSQPFAACCLIVLSAIFIYSATYRGGGEIPDEVKKQCLWFGIGFVCYLLTAMVDYHWLCRKAWFLYLGVIGLLVWVLKYGTTINDSRSWIHVKWFYIQPSEFAKLGVLLALCYYLSRWIGRLNEWRYLGMATALALIPDVLIHKQPDLGTALVIMALFFMLIFLAGAPVRLFAVLGMVAVMGLTLVGYEAYRYIQFRRDRVVGHVASEAKFKSFLHLKEYQFNRILGVVAPQELDPLAERWNADQSKIAIGSGKFYGKGWNKGDVTHGGYLPRTVSLNDFIFAVFAEETGFLGGVVLLGLYATLLFGGIHVAMKAHDSLGMLLAAGVTFLLFFHVFVNMGMTLGILPIVGIPLPLMSYGGSFVIVCMIALGLLQSVWLHRKPY